MDSVKIVELLVSYIIYLLPIIVIIYMMKRRCNKICERDISTAKQKNTTLDNEGDLEKFRKLVKFAREQKPEYYFTDDFYKLFSEIHQTTSDDLEQFGEYVSLELDCLRFQSSKEQLKKEIRKAIVQIAEEDTKSYLSDTSANISTSNLIVK